MKKSILLAALLLTGGLLTGCGHPADITDEVAAVAATAAQA